MSAPLSFNKTLAIKDIRREKIFGELTGSESVTTLSTEEMQPINTAKRLVMGEKSQQSGYIATFHSKKRAVRERFVARFDNCRIHAPKFYLFTKNDELLLESIPPARRQDPSGLREWEEIRDLAIRSIDEETIICGVHNYENYFHWHVDCLSGLILAEKAGIRGKVLVPPLKPWRAASLAYMGVQDKNLLPCGHGLLHLKRAYWPSSLVRRGFHMTDDVVETFDRIKRGAQRAGKLPSWHSDKVYIGRTDTNVRKLINEAALIEELTARGYTIITPGLCSYEEQIALMTNARVVVALHGAGLANMGFAPPICNIIEIFPETFINNGYYGMAQVTQQNYHCYSKNSFTGENTNSGQPSEWEIDIHDFFAEYGDMI